MNKLRNVGLFCSDFDFDSHPFHLSLIILPAVAALQLFVGQNFLWEEIQLIWLYIYPWEEGMTKVEMPAIRYPSSPLLPPSGHFGQTLSVAGDPLDLFFWALLLDMILLGT